MDDEKSKLINNTKNYKEELKNYETIVLEYIKILHEYLIHITNNIKITNKEHYKFIILRGYDLLKNILFFLVLYTNNIELVCFHLKKSFLYYTEFIGQIGEDSNSYLQLNSKDACLFVYKKTIYEIDESFKKNFKFKDNDEKKEIFKEKILLINRIEKLLIEKNVEKTINFNKEDERENLIKEIRIIIVRILNNLNEVKKEKILDKIKKINLFLDFIEFKKDKLFFVQIHHLITLFIKKIMTNTINDNNLVKLNLYYDETMDNLTSLKFINKIFKKQFSL